jgi:sialate O-acetylesterase
MFRTTLRPSFSLLVAIALNPSASKGDVHVPAIFGDHMVLQQEGKVPVWGTGEPGEKVTVTVGDHQASTTTGADGKWRVALPPFPNGAPATTMTIQGKNALTFQDVLIGDVWLASGQSNMEAALTYDYNGKDEAAKAKDPQLRLFRVARTTSVQPMSDVSSPFKWGRKPPYHESDGDQPGKWVVCNPNDAGEFSAVAYLFGKELRAHLQRPIGLIGSYWGGTVAEAWTSPSGLEKAPPFTTYLDARRKNIESFAAGRADYERTFAAYLSDLKTYEKQVKDVMAEWQAASLAYTKAQKLNEPLPPKPAERPALPEHPKAPSRPDGGPAGPGNLFDGMIAPLVPYAIKGVIWYQGESNTRNKALEYQLLFPRLIADWREKWGAGDFPFLYVQISHFGYAADGSSALVREAQVKALSVPKTAMVVTVDIPCDDAGHPHDKQDPAKRLALAARHVAYGEDVICSGPLYDSSKVEGGAIRIRLSNVGGGLIIGTTPYQPPTTNPKAPVPVLPTDKLVGFTIAGPDRKFVAAEARIDGQTVIVSSPQVVKPVAARFAWGDKVDCNLYNKENLPASPFRTDAWNDFTYHELAPGMTAPTFGPETFR